jgi:hypothetical protein
MTAPEQQTEQPDGYPALLDALVAAAVVQALASYNGIVSDLLVEELPPLLDALVVETLARVLAGTNSAARSLGTLFVDAAVAEARDEPVQPSPVPVRDDEIDALRGAVATLLDRVAVVADHPADAAPPTEPRTPRPRPTPTASDDRERERRDEARTKAKRDTERVAARDSARRERLVEDARRSRAGIELAKIVRREQSCAASSRTEP